jgi:Helix-turn-helix domain
MAKKKRRNKIAASLALTPVGRRNAPPGAINPAEQQFDLASPPTGPPGSTPRTAQVSKLDANALVSGPRLRRILDVSPVTLWRWRHDESMGFPAAKCIQGRLYFLLHEVIAWLERRPGPARRAGPVKSMQIDGGRLRRTAGEGPAPA